MSVAQLAEITSKYLQNTEIKLILELGSRDGLEAVALSHYYPNAKIISFECNPDTYPWVEYNISNHPNISAYKYAISDTNGFIDFYQSVHGNPGSSSIFPKSGKYDSIENMIQHKIQVESVTIAKFLEEHSLKNVDIIWADLQGAELKAFTGMADYINDVKVIYTEIYTGQPLYKDISEFLKNKNFIEEYQNCVVSNWWGDAVFIKKDLLEKNVIDT